MSEELYSQYLKRFQSAPNDNPISGLRSLFGGQETRGDVLREFQGAAPILNLGMANEREKRAQETESRKAQTEQSKQLMEIYKALHGQIKDFHGLPEDIKAVQRPTRIKEYSLFGKMLGFDETDAERMFTSPSYADTLMAAQDPSMRKELKEALTAELRSVQPGPAAGEQREKIIARYTTRHEQEAVDQARQALSLIPQRFAGRKDVSPQEVQALVGKEFPALSQSPAYRKAWATLMADDKLLASLGIQSPAAALEGQKKKAEVAAQGQKVDVMTSTGLATQGLTPATATPEQIAAAEQGAQKKRVEVSAAQGAGAVTAKAGAERDLPLVQSTLKEGNDTIIDRTTGNPVDPFTTTLKDIQTGGGQKRYARMNDKQFQAYQAVAESRTILDEFETVVKDFATKPGANLAQAVEFYAKTKLGVDNPGVALDTLSGTILRFAGAMQGSRTQISDQDRKSVEAMLPKSTDSFDVASKRIRMVRRIFDAMQKVQMGDMSNAKLKGAIDDAQRESASLIKIKGKTRLD